MDEESSLKSCMLPLILLLIFGGGIGTYVYTHWTGFRKDQPEEEEAPPPPKRAEPKPAVEPVKEPEKPAEPEEPPPPPKKTVAELKAEADAAQEELDRKIAAAREQSAGKELPGFAGVRFGEVVNETPLATVKLPGTGDLETDGFGIAMQGPTLKRAFMAFGTRPKVWVTPKTHRVYRIEFAHALNRLPGPMPDAETTNLVAVLERKFRRDALHLDPEKFPLGRREYVFPLGTTTLTVGEYGGGMLKLVVENEAMHDDVRKESAAERKRQLAEEPRVKALGSDKYPKAGAVKLTNVRMKKGTLRKFCGIAFGALPPYGAKISNPKDGCKAFFIDYRKSKCRPFMGFTHGRAEIGRANNAVYAVELHSDGAYDGLTDVEYFARVRQAIEGYYETKPISTKGQEPLPTLVYGIGDADITLGPDPAGGFRLRAENTMLKALW